MSKSQLLVRQYFVGNGDMDKEGGKGEPPVCWEMANCCPQQKQYHS